MSRYPVSALADLHENTAHAVACDGVDLVLIRCGDEVFALEDICSHAEVALSEGEVNGYHIECWMHGSAFDARTGLPDSPPATKPVRTFPVSISDHDGASTVFVEIG